MSHLVNIAISVLLLYVLSGLFTLVGFGVARVLGLQVTEVSFGLGRALWKRTTPGAGALRLALLPGGFVRVKGWTRSPEDLATFAEVYGERGLGKRTLVAISGPLALLAAGWLAAVAHAWLSPQQIWVLPLTVQTVSSSSPAERAGLAPGDQLLRLGQHVLSGFEQLPVAAATCGTCQLELRRGGHLLQLPVQPALFPGSSNYALGVTLEMRREARTLGTALVQGGNMTSGMIELQLRQLAILFAGAKHDVPSGPQLMLRVGASRAPWGWLTLTTAFAVMLSFVNMLPGPGFAGGHLLLLGIEAVTGRQLAPEREQRLLGATMLVVIGWFVVVTVLLDL